MTLNALAQELDRSLLAYLPNAAGSFSVAEYCAAYRSMNDRAGRARQIRLTLAVGRALDSFVGSRLIRAALVVMREPARIADMMVLHDFLERGFRAFRRMRGADVFLATIAERETALMETIFEGASAPFVQP
jgi:hypothetical protein